MDFSDEEVSVAFSTGDVKSLRSDLAIKVPEKFHSKSSHQETVPALQRRALQLAEEDIQSETKKPEFHTRFPLRPVLAYPTGWYKMLGTMNTTEHFQNTMNYTIYFIQSINYSHLYLILRMRFFSHVM